MIGAVLSRFVDVLKDGVSMLWIAPLIAALVMVPEGIQHGVEIQLGMFESKDSFNGLADHPDRMIWGYLKIAGLILCILATIRFWSANARGQKWWDLRHIAWKNVVIAIVLSGLITLPEILLASYIGDEIAGYVSIALTLLTLPLLALLVAGLAGDKSVGLVSIFKTGWLVSLRIVIFAAAVWVPLQWIHGLNHIWALGQAESVVWALMVFDTLVVGLLALLAGTAIHHGYTLEKTAKPPQ